MPHPKLSVLRKYIERARTPTLDSTNLPDEELLARIYQNDHHALSVLYERYARLVFGIGIQVLQDEGQAEEMTQDVFVSIWRRAGSYRSDRAKVSTWIGSIAHHRAIDIVRRRNRDAAIFAQLVTDIRHTPMWGGALELHAERSWEREKIRAAMDDLPDEQKEAILLAFFRGLSHSEVAQALSQPLGTVKTRIRLGMQKLRERLHDDLRGTQND